jgi:membrane protein implicated in regulation of membrane protease activity
MANDDTAAGLPAAYLPQVKTGPLMVGGILVGVGTVVALAGVAVAGVTVAAATWAWVKELETPPDQLARLRWEQAKTAVSAAAASWREHPNSQVHLVRRAPSGTD